MNDEILLVQNESGKFEKYEPYAEIVCNTEAEFEKINEAMRQYQGWIDINDRLPDPEEYVLVSFENFTLPDIGRYEAESDGSGAFYTGDEDASYVSFGVFVAESIQERGDRIMIIKSVKLENWAKSQKRVTIGRIRKEFGVDEEMAQNYYDYLKSAGIVGRMGYVKYAE